MPSGNQFAHSQYIRVVTATSAADSSFSTLKTPLKDLLGVIYLGPSGRYYSVHSLHSGIRSSTSVMGHRDKE